MGQHLWNKTKTRWTKQEGDAVTGAMTTVDYAHHEIHSGSFWHVSDESADIGGETGDHITIQFTTPAASSGLVHALFNTNSSGAYLWTLREGQTGGGTGGGALTAYNRRRSSTTTHGMTILKDSSLGTGGTVLEQFNFGALGGLFASGGQGRHAEWVLAPATIYQARVYVAAAQTAEISMDFYLHTDRIVPANG